MSMIGRSWVKRTLGPMAKGSLRSSIFTLMSAAIGSGVLLLPYAFRLVGVPIGLLGLGFGAYCIAQSLQFIMAVAHLTGCETYAGAVATVLGRRAGTVLSSVMVGESFCVIAAWLKFLADLAPRLIPAIIIGETRERQMFFVACVAVLPCLFKDISVLSRVAIISPMSLVCVTVLIVGRACTGPSEEVFRGGANSAADTIDLLRSGTSGWREIPSMWSIVMNALVCHHMAVPVYRQMKAAQAYRVNKVVMRTVVTLVFLYGLVGTCGFLMNGRDTPENILLAYNKPGDRTAILAKGLVGISLLIAIPLNLNPARRQVLEFMPRHWHLRAFIAAPLGHCVFTVLMVGGPAIMATLAPSVTSIVSLACGFSMVFWVFLVPAFMLLLLRWRGGTGLLQTPDRISQFGSGTFSNLLLSSPLSTPMMSPRPMVYPKANGNINGKLVTNLSHQLEAGIPSLKSKGASGRVSANSGEEAEVPAREDSNESAGSAVSMTSVPPVGAPAAGGSRDTSLTRVLEGARSSLAAVAAVDHSVSPERSRWQALQRQPMIEDDDEDLEWSPRFAMALVALIAAAVMGIVAACEAAGSLIRPAA